ncbi:MAG: carboxypeptidase regulatory-like domain-containing protein [Thermoanaerobaculia bacterium]|nr:carboxypeptidase regulatory-like domain-containing protein [Thermoanaerobaculia bacterium]
MTRFLLLALLLSPAMAAGEAPPDWRLLYEDGTVLAAPAPGAETGEAAAPVAVWGWSERHAPRAMERFGEELGPEDAGRLEVRVTRPRPAREGEPAAPLRLVAAPAAMWDLFPERWLPSWPVPESGRLALPHRKGERWRLRLVGEAEGSWWVDLPAGRARAELSSARAGGVEILLTDPEGRPVDGATVNLFRSSASGATAPRFWSRERSERGRVRWAGVPDRETLFVWVRPRGELAETTVSGLPSELPQAIRLAPGARAVGRVVDEEGRPLPGVRIRLESWVADGFAASSAAESGSDGRWEVTGLPPGRAALVLRADGRVSDARQVELRAGANDLGSATLARGVTLAVRLVGGDGLPVAGGTVRSGRLVEARSGADGRARLEGLPLAPLDLRGTADRHLEGRARVNPPFPPEVELVLPRAFTVEGRIVDVAGVPLAGAWLKLSERARLCDLTVEESGRFLSDLRPGAAAHLEAGAPGAVSERWPIAAGEAGEWRDLGDLVLGRGLEVAGRVVAADTGEPLGGARIWAPRPGQFGPEVAWASGDLVEAATGGDGRFRLSGLRAGPLLLRVDAPGRARAHRDLLLTDEEPVSDAGEIPLGRGTTVHVVVAGLDPDGAESRSAEARVDLRGEWQALDLLRAPLREGRATVRNVPPGRVLVSVQAGPRLLCERAVSVPADEPEIEVECDGEGPEVSGTVWSGDFRATGGSLTWSTEQAPRSGRILNRASPGGLVQQSVVGIGRPAVLVPVAPDGSFRTTELVAGRWTVTWNASGGTLSPPLEVVIPAAERFETALRFPGEGLAGRVVDEEGDPVAGARIVELTSGAFALSRDDGGFTLTGLAPGPYAVQARDRELASEIAEGVLEAGEPAPEIVLVLGEGQRLRFEVRVATADGAPAAGAFVFLDFAGQGARILTADRTGVATAEISPPLPESVRVAATTGAGWSFSGWVPWREARAGISAVLGSARLLVRVAEGGGVPRLLAPGGWDLGLLALQLGAPLRLAPDAPLLLAGLPAGSYRIELGGAAAAVDLAEGDVAEIELSE